MISPGIVGLYWLLASAVTATAWHLTARSFKRAARAAALVAHTAGRGACPCGGHQ